MATIYYDKDADLDLIKDKMIGIIGFGSQGHAHSQNLKESGCNVMVGELKGSEPWKNAEAAGLNVASAADVSKASYFPRITIPDPADCWSDRRCSSRSPPLPRSNRHCNSWCRFSMSAAIGPVLASCGFSMVSPMLSE